MTIPERTIKEDVFERTTLGLAVTALFLVGYFAVGLSTIPARAHDFSTPLDRRIPFIAGTVWIYLWSYTASLIPVFIIRCYKLFRRILLAYAIAISLSLICFAAVPVTSRSLRADGVDLHSADPSHWAVSAIYSLDPPYNLFPSLHVCLTALAAIAAWKANRWFGSVLFVGLGLVVISVCTVKQHFVLDALSGLALAALVGGTFIGPYHREGANPGYSWRGPASYLLSLMLMYAGFYTTYLWTSLAHHRTQH